MAARMSGWSVLGMISLIREEYGDTGWSRFQQDLPSYAAALLEKKIQASQWYPYSFIGEIGRASCRERV